MYIGHIVVCLALQTLKDNILVYLSCILSSLQGKFIFVKLKLMYIHVNDLM